MEANENQFRFSLLFVCCCFYLHVCSFGCSYKVLSFSSFLLFIFNNCSFNLHSDIDALSSLSMTKTNSVPVFLSADAVLTYND